MPISKEKYRSYQHERDKLTLKQHDAEEDLYFFNAGIATIEEELQTLTNNSYRKKREKLYAEYKDRQKRLERELKQYTERLNFLRVAIRRARESYRFRYYKDVHKEKAQG